MSKAPDEEKCEMVVNPKNYGEYLIWRMEQCQFPEGVDEVWKAHENGLLYDDWKEYWRLNPPQ